MTKVEAIAKVMADYNGVATWQIIYNDIEKYYPNAKHSVYWQEGLRGVLYRDLGKTFKQIDIGIFALSSYDERDLLPVELKNDFDTDREVITKVRILQQKFRASLLQELKICPITQVVDKRLLVASHIKPWCVSSSEERLDVNNGFILSPLYDAMFDKGLITFSNDKELLISSTLNSKTICNLNIIQRKYELLPLKNREKYLEFHREKIFIK